MTVIVCAEPLLSRDSGVTVRSTSLGAVRSDGPVTEKVDGSPAAAKS
ncbi:MAG: hypothetical protein AB1679_17495 [Actinomycetota bacterium]